MPIFFVLKSSAFSDQEEIPKRYTGEDADLSPDLQWLGIPQDTREFALICEDPDAPRAEPWVHWVLYKIPGKIVQLPEGIPPHERVEAIGALQGKNSWNTLGYRGPLPPPGHGWHHYFFKLYALDQELALKPGCTKEELVSAMKRHILSEAFLVGKYKRE